VTAARRFGRAQATLVLAAIANVLGMGVACDR
jgi:hypothetical protein